MPDGVNTLAGWSTAAAAIAGAAVLLWKVTRGARRFVRRAEMFWEDWTGIEDRDGVPGHPGVMARLSRIEKRLATVEHELYPNSGSSIRDALDRIDRRTEHLEPAP